MVCLICISSLHGRFAFSVPASRKPLPYALKLLHATTTYIIFNMIVEIGTQRRLSQGKRGLV
jgi:hypothetical protein